MINPPKLTKIPTRGKVHASHRWVYYYNKLIMENMDNVRGLNWKYHVRVACGTALIDQHCEAVAFNLETNLYPT